MPVYEYNCQECNLKFEYLIRSGKEDIVCPRCGHKDLKRLISAFAFNSKDSRGNIIDSSSGSCSGCTGHNCSTCAQ